MRSRKLLPFLIAVVSFSSAGFISSCALLPTRDSDSFDQEPTATQAWDEIYSENEKKLEERRQALEQARQREQQAIRRGLASHDVVVGMRAEDVVGVWGEPPQVEYAGERASGNERWVYTEGLSHFPSLSRKRVIYFENGKVAGWTTTQ